MRVGTPGFVGGRLREAREARGLTTVALAEITGGSPQAISQYEAGRSTPSPEVFNLLAAGLNLPSHFFTMPERQRPRGPIFNRSMSSATKRARTRAERRFVWLQDITAYLSEYVDLPTSNFPHLGLPADPLLLSDDEIEIAATEVRRYWNMRDAPVANVLRLLENQGAIVARDRLGAEALDGISEFSPSDKRPFIIVGIDKGTPARWRFDAAHELGHIILHAGVDGTSLRKPEQFKRIEQQANRFAAAFLLPLATFGDELFAPTLDAFRVLKARWGVSIAMMIIRSRHAGLLSEDSERKLWINYGRRGWRKNEPYDDATDVERPFVLRRAFELILEKGEVTTQDVRAGIPLSVGDIEALGGLERGYLDDAASIATLKHRFSERRGVGDVTDMPAGQVIPLPLRPRSA